MQDRCTLLLLLVIAHALSGCAMWQGKRTPDIPPNAKEPLVEPVPSIKVVFGHEHKMEGDRREWAEGLSSREFTNSYERTAKESPVMRYAGNQLAPINYLLFLDTAINEHGQAMAIISGLSFMLFPVVLDSDVIVTGTLYEAATGREVGIYEGKGKVNVLVWLPLLPAAPITMILAPGKELYDDSFRAVYYQMAEALKGQPLPPAIEPGRVDIQRVPEHVQREIRIKPQPTTAAQ